MQPTFDLTLATELDARANDGVEVRLLWHAPTDSVAVEVVDGRSNRKFAFAIEANEALDAFRHPFAYAAREDRASAPMTELAAELDPIAFSLDTTDVERRWQT